METVTLELVYKKILGMEQKLEQLTTCFHDDFLELSEKTKMDIEESRKQIREGKCLTLQEL